MSAVNLRERDEEGSTPLLSTNLPITVLKKILSIEMLKITIESLVITNNLDSLMANCFTVPFIACNEHVCKRLSQLYYFKCLILFFYNFYNNLIKIII